MTTEVLTALIRASRAILTRWPSSLNHLAFTMLDSRIGDTNRGKEFMEVLDEHDKRIERLEDKP
jgi:hypothetical protein